MAHELPPLPYDYSALEPYIDEQTMHIHHDKHHAAYVTNLNKTLESAPTLQGKSLEDLLANLSAVPDGIRQAVINNGGGVYNHTVFWGFMAPKAGGEPTGEVATAINAAFGNFAAFKDKLSNAGMTRFGSGWGWLSANALMSYLTIIAAALVFVKIEHKAKEPIVDLKFFKNSIFVNTLINNFVVFMGMMGGVFLIPIFAQTFLGYTATQSGYLFIPMAVMMMTASPLGGMLTGKVKSKYIIFATDPTDNNIIKYEVSNINNFD